MREITLLEFPSNLGLKELSSGHEPGVRKLPEWLRKFGFQQSLKAVKETRLDPPPYTMNLDPVSGVRNADAIVDYALRQTELLSDVLTESNFVMTIGGDCSILIGNMLALKKKGNYGLFFLDGHTDFVTPDMSQTGGAAGMDLAIVTGYGHHKLTDIERLKPYVMEENTWCVGNRYLESHYVNTIQRSSIHYIDLYAIRSGGLKRCAEDFLKMVKDKELDGFWIHLDVDVLDSEIMPAVDSPQEDGLQYEELREILSILITNPKATGLNLTILDPELDPEGTYTQKFVEEFIRICSVLKT